MPNILTPLSLWETFDSSLETLPEIISSTEDDGVAIEKLTIRGRETGEGRVTIAAAFAFDAKAPAGQTVVVFSDSKDTIDFKLLKMFVDHGYSALMIDYRGVWEGCDFYTRYPENISYANFSMSGRHYGYVDDNAVSTSWYEWVAAGIYACKYARERSGGDDIAVVGLRDGGEIAWKLGVAERVKCIIPVCAAGWRAYEGISKYLSVEPGLNDERYRFIAGIDSQAYAPNICCPVLMLCATNDSRFDYDRAYDTFSRINPEFIDESAIAYSVQSNGCIGPKCTADMFMFLDKNLKNRQVFIPKPAEISVEVDEESNLIARAIFDSQGIVDYCEMYIAEDCIDSALREWDACRPKSKIRTDGQEFYLDIYEKTNTVFVFCYVKYINGFTVWSKIAAKKISGMFRNMRPKCRVLYSDMEGSENFANAEPEKCAVGGMFFLDKTGIPSVVEKGMGVTGLYCVNGLTTYRMNNPRFAPLPGNLLKLDIFCDKTATVRLSFSNSGTNEEFYNDYEIIGGVWQSIIAECTSFKNSAGTALSAFSQNTKFSIICGENYAVNNIIWL